MVNYKFGQLISYNSFMQEEKFIMFQNRLAKVFRHLSRQARRLHVSCYRIYDHDLPEFPFCIELYEDKLYVAEYKRHHGLSEEQHDEWIKKSMQVISEVLNVQAENIFLKLRKVKTSRADQYKKTAGEKNEFIVHENDLKFIVNLSDYLDTGLFLDHRITREMVKKESAGKKVLNLFCYTGSFSVCAAAGGAVDVVSVDLSKTYLAWARKNMELNGFTMTSPLGAEGYVHTDVMSYLKTLPENYFDLVVLDPPTFSNSQRMDKFLDIQKDHAELINDCLRVMKPKGVLYFSTNSRKFILEKEKIKASSVKDITKATTSFDFEGRLFRYCFRIEKE